MISQGRKKMAGMRIKRYYSVKDVVEILGIARGTLYNWEKAKKIPRPKRNRLSNYRLYTIEDIKKIKKLMGVE